MKFVLKRRSKWLILSLSILVGIGAIAYALSGHVVGWVLKRALADLMQSGVDVTVHNSDPSALELSVRADEFGLSLEQLKPRTRFQGFFPPEIGVSLEHHTAQFMVKGVGVREANIEIDAQYAWSGRWKAKAVLKAAAAEGAGFSGRNLLCDVTATEGVLQAKLRLLLPEGPMTAELSGHGSMEANVDLTGSVEVKAPFLEFNSPFVIRRTASDVILRMQSPGSYFRTRYGAGTGLDIGVSHKQGSLDIRIDKLHPRMPEILRGFVRRASIGVALSGRRTESGYKLLGTLTEQFSGLKAELRGSSLSSGAVVFDVALPIDFEKQTLFQMTEKPEEFGKWKGTGNITFHAIRSSKGRLDGKLRADLDGVQGAWKAIPLQGAALKCNVSIKNGTFKGDGVQALRIERLGNAFQVRRIEIEALLPSEDKISVARLEANLASGRLYARPFTLLIPSLDMATEIRVDEFDLEQGAKGFQLDAISAKGRAHAKVPVAFEDGRLLISGARIENVGPGVVRYKDPSVALVKKEISLLDDFSNLLSMGQQALVFKALDNFHFEKLQLDFDRTLKKDTEITIRLKGRNPDLAKGQPFELNLPLTGQIEKLLMQSLLKSLMEKQLWEEQIETWKRKQPKH